MWKTALQLLKATFSDFQKDHVSRLAAALAYYSVFSLGPLLLIALSIAELAFDEEAARGAVEAHLQNFVGQDTAAAVQDMMQSANRSGDSVGMAIVGSAILLVSASGVFAQLKDAMNTVWDIALKPGGGIITFLKSRALSLSMVLVVGFLLLVSLIASTLISTATGWVEGVFPIHPLFWQAVNFVLFLVAATFLFAMIFKILPDAEIEWRDVWIGAFLTSALFSIGKLLLALYLGREDAGSAYGAAGALILLLSWVFYTANILLFGAEFTQVYSHHRGRDIQPTEGAVAVGDGAKVKA